MPHLFTLPIGDWSDDGHGECSYFTVESNKTVQEAREAHFKIKEVTGIDIESFVSEYEDNIIPEEILDQLVQLGFSKELAQDAKDHATPNLMFDIWSFLLQKADPELHLTHVDPDIPMLPFYGFDDKKRHIGFVGYGLFD